MSRVIFASPQFASLKYAALEDWPGADFAKAIAAYAWSAGPCALGLPPDGADPIIWFQSRFQPVLVSENTQFTAYYEPEIAASFQQDARFRHPLFRRPSEELRNLTRTEIDRGALSGRGLEIAWIEHPIDGFLMQVQGCGRLILPDGQVLRIGYAGQNGQPYRSVGAELVRLGMVTSADISALAIREYVIASPAAGRDLMQHNQSYVFFKTMPALRDQDGPIGTLGVPLTARHSIAVDPAFIALGLPVWVETASADLTVNAMFIAQDTGGAIKGINRADLFLGCGPAAGALAGRINQAGRLIAFRPRPVA